MKWRVVLEADAETGELAVWCPELPGCVSCGETEEEALENILKAIYHRLSLQTIFSLLSLSYLILLQLL